MKNLLSLFVLCGSVLGALAFVTNLSSHSVNPTVKLSPGQMIQEGSLVSVEYTLTDANALKVDTMLMMKTSQGQALPMRVKEIKEKTVVVDLNNPLAGKTLTFDVKIKDIKEAAK